MTETQIALFLISSLIVIMTPGQDLLLVISRGITNGSSAGVVTASGLSVGLLGHTVFATFGLGALLLASDTVFTVVKYIGAAYLIYLGYKLFTAHTRITQNQKSASGSLKNCFATGVLSNLSNPKVTLFYFAYLPQFVPKSEGSPLILLLLGVTFTLLAFIVKASIGYAAGRASDFLLNKKSFFSWFNRFSGILLIGLGIRLAFEQK